jgi:hypothetical protein
LASVAIVAIDVVVVGAAVVSGVQFMRSGVHLVVLLHGGGHAEKQFFSVASAYCSMAADDKNKHVQMGCRCDDQNPARTSLG